MAIYKFTLPELGEGMHEGEVVKWHIRPGDTVQEDQTIMDVQNDKAIVEVPSPVNGKVLELNVKEGTVCVVGDVLVTFEIEGEAPAQPAHGGHGRQETSAAPVQANGKAVTEDAPTSAPPSAQTSPSGKDQVRTSGVSADEDRAGAQENAVQSDRTVLAAPSVRKLARDKGVPIAQLKGTGRHGQVTKSDIERFLAEGGAAAAPIAADTAEPQQTKAVLDDKAASSPGRAIEKEWVEERVPLKGIRRAIANAMVKSAFTAPHVTLMDEAEVGELIAFRQKAKPLAEARGVKLTYLPFIVKAFTAAAKRYPAINASLDENTSEIVYKKVVHVGIATDTEQGLIVPVVTDADRKSIWTIAEEIRDLSSRGKEGKLQAHELKGSTISITNIGSAGGMFFTPIINYPEVAILGTGRISEKPVVKNGQLAVGSVMALSFSFDHRVIDGMTAQNALNYIKQLLEDPQLLILEV